VVALIEDDQAVGIENDGSSCRARQSILATSMMAGGRVATSAELADRRWFGVDVVVQAARAPRAAFVSPADTS